MDVGFLLFLIALVALMYFMVVLPQRRASKRHQEMVSQLKEGDDVVTLGGLYGTISEMEDGDTLLLEVAEDTDVRVSRASIARVITEHAADDESAEASTE